MNFPAIFQWISQNHVVCWLFFFLIWKEFLMTARYLYAERQKRLTQLSNSTVKLSENQLAEKRLEGQKGEGASK